MRFLFLIALIWPIHSFADLESDIRIALPNPKYGECVSLLGSASKELEAKDSEIQRLKSTIADQELTILESEAKQAKDKRKLNSDL